MSGTTMRTDVSALYIDPRGPYPKLLADCWDESRDARLYAGPNPVVAHPPCGPWSKQRHNYRGTEHDCAPRALEQVRAFGGVLEHPAESRFWSDASLPLPAKPLSLMGGHGWRGGAMYAGLMVETDGFGGFTVAVEQCAWGHVDRAADGTTLARALKAFFAQQAEDGRAAGTLKMYDTHAAHLCEVLGEDSPIASIGAEELDGYVSTRRAEGAKDPTIHKELTTLRGTLKLARRHRKYPFALDEVMPKLSGASKPGTRHLLLPAIKAGETGREGPSRFPESSSVPTLTGTPTVQVGAGS